MNMNFKRKLPIPMEIKEQYPITYELEQMKEKRDQEIKAVFEGRNDRFILIIGPCSADNDDSVIDSSISSLLCSMRQLKSEQNISLCTAQSFRWKSKRKNTQKDYTFLTKRQRNTV